MTLLLLILGHFLSDFWLQSDAVAKNKELRKENGAGDRSFALLSHVMTHILVTSVIVLIHTIFFNSQTLSKNLLLKTVVILFLIAINGFFHYFVDSLIRPRLRLNQLRFKRTMPYLFDQVLHLSSIYLLLYVSNLIIKSISKTISPFDLTLLNINPYSKYILLVIFVVILTSFAGILIEFIFADLESEHRNIPVETIVKNQDIKLDKLTQNYDSTITIEEQYSPGNYEAEVNPNKISKRTTSFEILEYDEINNYGKLIGYFERIIIFITILSGKVEGITILLGLKTFSRFKQLDSKRFTEKYILGTLISSTVAILLGILYSKLFK